MLKKDFKLECLFYQVDHFISEIRLKPKNKIKVLNGDLNVII